LQHEVTDPINPSKNAAGKTANERLDDFKISADHSSIVELHHLGQQAAVLGEGQHAPGFDAETKAW
jgi:hypothetical protein